MSETQNPQKTAAGMINFFRTADLKTAEIVLGLCASEVEQRKTRSAEAKARATRGPSTGKRKGAKKPGRKAKTSASATGRAVDTSAEVTGSPMAASQDPMPPTPGAITGYPVQG